MRRSGVKKWKKTCVSLTSLSSPHFFFPFFSAPTSKEPLEPSLTSRSPSSLQQRAAAAGLQRTTREEREEEEEEEGRREGETMLEQMQKKKKNMNHKNKNNIPPFLWLLYLRAGCGCGGGWLTGEDKIKHCKAVETILSWLCESVDIKWQHYTCAVKASAILQPTIVLQNVSQPVKTGFRCRVVDPPAGFVPLAAWTQNSKFTTVPDSRLWGWRWMTDSRGRVMTRQDRRRAPFILMNTARCEGSFVHASCRLALLNQVKHHPCIPKRLLLSILSVIQQNVFSATNQGLPVSSLRPPAQVKGSFGLEAWKLWKVWNFCCSCDQKCRQL